jgi:very-short-patch-repair endonuclease
VGRPDLDAFFDQSTFERFFVKNLERVQGDERDAIILTIGYGKDERGRLPYRFGPLLQQGGERRLNVAITRARKRMTVVSAFSHHEMDPGRSTARGVELLRSYLEYAAQGGQTWVGERPEPVLDTLQADIRGALEGAGVEVAPQWGASRNRIDFAAESPEDETRFLLAIETDGPSYRSAATARDRDRTREQVLEGLGWRFHRIWTTDWFMRRDEEMARLVSDFRAAADPPAPATLPVAGPSAPAVEAASSGPARGPRPRIGRRGSIEDYTMRDLVSMVAWLQSDGQLRTDEELVDELVDQLGFSRRGPRIEAALRAAVGHYRARPPSR